MIRIAVVDDEEIFADLIANKTNEFFSDAKQNFDISVFTNSKEMVDSCKTESYDLLLLDIDMPELTGFDLAKLIRAYNRYITIIFITNKDELVFESFEFNPFSFVRKSKIDVSLSLDLQRFLNEYNKRTKLFELIIDNKSVQHRIRDILLFSTVRHDVYVKLIDGENYRLTSRKYTLDKLEDELKNDGFIRVHKTYLVNYLGIYQLNENKIILKDKNEIPVSRRRIEEVKNRYKILLRSDIR